MDYLEELFSLAGRTAVVTGGSGTLAGAIGLGLLRAGANLALWSRDPAKLAAQRERLLRQYPEAAGERVFTCAADMAKREEIDAGLARTATHFGSVDILVNAAGGSSIRRPLVESDPAEFEETIRLNLFAGCYLPTRQFAAYWIEAARPGCVVNIASMASYNPLSEAWAYSAAKAAVMNQTMAQARELAPHGIRVNAVAPGFFLSNQNRHLLTQPDGTPTARGERVLAHTPAGRFGDPDELCSGVLFLCAPGSTFVTGATVPIDGGYLCSNI